MMSAFSGDKYLKQEFLNLVKTFNIKNIVETGTYKGYSTKEFAKMVENVYTIESNKKFYSIYGKNLKGIKNIQRFLGSSPKVMHKILPKLEGKTLFFLDAHLGNYWPILDELEEISKIKTLSDSVIVIHDFYVPGTDLGFDSYHFSNSSLELFLKKIISLMGKILKMNLIEKQKLDYDFIKDKLKKINSQYKYYYNSIADGTRRGVIFIHP